ncbi:hydrogenase 4 membrane subunit [Niveibacterium umoris]|uniref:Hydrogenase-4 component E n=1 Tax=Niveibacterium umoris TaxID=1193620 RepID=A0A840BI58_9RHOO|nr:hydrogenase 4 membrane subunit [Niveibacterium umoris]MBB4012670.1 hydrogenase-4 component E [Niveibacterium umoris]
MNGTLIVNSLAGLLIVTSLLVTGARSTAQAAKLYALQSFVLVLIFLALATSHGAHELYLWSASAFVTKVVLVPLIMLRALGPLAQDEELPGVLSPAWLVLVAAVIVGLSCYAVSSVQLAVVAQLKPALGVSLGHFLLGLVCIVSQRNLLKQIFGYCLMENGAHLTLALLAYKAPELVEVGIATDAVFAVVIMAVLARTIHRTLHTLDVRQLTALKG